MRTLRALGGGAAARRGGVIVLCLIVLTALMMLGAGLYRFATATQSEVGGNEDDRRAFYLAEAGVAEAMAALRTGASGGVASQAAPAYLSGGVLWVTSTDLGGSRYELVSMGMAGSGRAALSVVVEDEGLDPLFYATLNSKDTLTLNSDVVVDSFDSELGTYASQVGSVTPPPNGHPYANDQGHVASNDDIVLNAGSTVVGDATPGPGHNVTTAPTSYVKGSKAAAAAPFTFPPIPVPSLGSSGPLTVPANGSLALPPGKHGFDDLTINKAGQLTITGPATLVVNNFTGGKDARMHIDATGGPVTIFVQGNYTHLANFEAQPVGSSPMALAFMVQGNQDVVFPSNGMIRGAYYVPNANVQFSSGSEAWGSFAANRIDMSNAMRFHFDESLSKHWDADTGKGKDPLEFLAWQPAPVPAALLRDRRDPYQVLGVNQAGLLSPANSWIP